MVDAQLRGRDVVDLRVLAAMERVPRELFVPQKLRDRAYDDAALPIGDGQTISQPYMVARICEALALTGPERVLDVGTGSGYQAAVLADLAAEVDRPAKLDAVQAHGQAQQLVSRSLPHPRRHPARTDRTQTPQNPSSPRSGTKRHGTERRTAGPSGLRTITSRRCMPRRPTGTTSRPRGSSCS